MVAVPRRPCEQYHVWYQRHTAKAGNLYHGFGFKSSCTSYLELYHRRAGQMFSDIASKIREQWALTFKIPNGIMPVLVPCEHGFCPGHGTRACCAVAVSRMVELDPGSGLKLAQHPPLDTSSTRPTSTLGKRPCICFQAPLEIQCNFTLLVRWLGHLYRCRL